MRWLSVDPGFRRIGLALSDEDGRLALPHKTVLRKKDGKVAADEVAEVAREAEVVEVVFGLPLDMDGSEGNAARRARAFGKLLEARIEVPLVYWDERMTSMAAKRSLQEIGVHGDRQKAVLDQSAAALLLQSYLDARTKSTWDENQIDAFVEAGPVQDGPRRGRRGRGRGKKR